MHAWPRLGFLLVCSIGLTIPKYVVAYKRLEVSSDMSKYWFSRGGDLLDAVACFLVG